jgi:DNA-binding phage protein
MTTAKDNAPVSEWRIRLKQKIEDSHRSMRAISLASGRGPSFLYEVLVNGREPSIENLIAICDTLNVSLSWLLYGYDLGRQEEELLKAFGQLSPRQRQAILDLTRDRT